MISFGTLLFACSGEIACTFACTAAFELLSFVFFGVYHAKFNSVALLPGDNEICVQSFFKVSHSFSQRFHWAVVPIVCAMSAAFVLPSGAALANTGATFAAESVNANALIIICFLQLDLIYTS